MLGLDDDTSTQQGAAPALCQFQRTVLLANSSSNNNIPSHDTLLSGQRGGPVPSLNQSAASSWMNAATANCLNEAPAVRVANRLSIRRMGWLAPANVVQANGTTQTPRRPCSTGNLGEIVTTESRPRPSRRTSRPTVPWLQVLPMFRARASPRAGTRQSV